MIGRALTLGCIALALSAAPTLAQEDKLAALESKVEAMEKKIDGLENQIRRLSAQMRQLQARTEGEAQQPDADAERKAATLLRSTDAPGTSSDALIIGCATHGPPVRFSGSITPVGAAVRACVRDAIAASLRSRYGSARPPGGTDAAHGSTTSVRPTVASLRLIEAADGDAS
jgi:TolA-binding protein